METVALCMDETTFYQKLDAIKKSKNGNSQLTVFVNNELYKGLCGNATLLFQNLIKNSNVLWIIMTYSGAVLYSLLFAYSSKNCHISRKKILS